MITEIFLYICIHAVQDLFITKKRINLHRLGGVTEHMEWHYVIGIQKRQLYSFNVTEKDII